jgi:hypothetical protein
LQVYWRYIIDWEHKGISEELLDKLFIHATERLCSYSWIDACHILQNLVKTIESSGLPLPLQDVRMRIASLDARCDDRSSSQPSPAVLRQENEAEPQFAARNAYGAIHNGLKLADEMKLWPCLSSADGVFRQPDKVSLMQVVVKAKEALAAALQTLDESEEENMEDSASVSGGCCPWGMRGTNSGVWSSETECSLSKGIQEGCRGAAKRSLDDGTDCGISGGGGGGARPKIQKQFEQLERIESTRGSQVAGGVKQCSAVASTTGAQTSLLPARVCF